MEIARFEREHLPLKLTQLQVAAMRVAPSHDLSFRVEMSTDSRKGRPSLQVDCVSVPKYVPFGQ